MPRPFALRDTSKNCIRFDWLTSFGVEAGTRPIVSSETPKRRNVPELQLLRVPLPVSR